MLDTSQLLQNTFEWRGFQFFVTLLKMTCYQNLLEKWTVVNLSKISNRMTNDILSELLGISHLTTSTSKKDIIKDDVIKGWPLTRTLWADRTVRPKSWGRHSPPPLRSSRRRWCCCRCRKTSSAWRLQPSTSRTWNQPIIIATGSEFPKLNKENLYDFYNFEILLQSNYL